MFLLLLSAAIVCVVPALADARLKPRPKPGAWVGATTQVWKLGPDLRFELSEQVTFTLRRTRGGPNPRYRVRDFQTSVAFNPFLADCVGYSHDFDFSAIAKLRTADSKRIGFQFEDTERIIYPEGSTASADHLYGVFPGRLKAKGHLGSSEEVNWAGVDYDRNCRSGYVTWEAHHR